MVRYSLVDDVADGRYRREIVDGVSKAGLRSTVADALLEYRRTCDTADVDALQVASENGVFCQLNDCYCQKCTTCKLHTELSLQQ